MEEVLKKYQLISCARELTALIGKRTQMWVVLQDAYPHIIRSYGNRLVYLKADWEQDKLLIMVDVAFPPQQMTTCFKAFSKAYYDAVPEKVRQRFTIDKL
jgi:hypothetical protein